MGECEAEVKILCKTLHDGLLDVTSFVMRLHELGWTVSSINFNGEGKDNTVTFCRPNGQLDEDGWPLLGWVTL